MTNLELCVAGPAAGKALEILEAILIRGTDLHPQRYTLQSIPPEDEKIIDPLAVASLIVAIPCGILAAIHLTDRIGKRHKAKELTEKAASLVINGNLTITISINGGIPKPLQSLTPDQLLELAEKAMVKSE